LAGRGIVSGKEPNLAGWGGGGEEGASFGGLWDWEKKPLFLCQGKGRWLSDGGGRKPGSLAGRGGRRAKKVLNTSQRMGKKKGGGGFGKDVKGGRL